MNRPYTQTHAAFARAKKAMPYGVTSNFRYSGEDTMVVKRGEGAYIWDMDDNRYIDYRLAFGPIILGHADPRVNKAVVDAISGTPTDRGDRPVQEVRIESVTIDGGAADAPSEG